MSPFKEPQPRKQPVKVTLAHIEGTAPFAYVAPEDARKPLTEPWPEEKVEQVKREAEAIKDFRQELDAARLDLDYRRIALEWSVTYWSKDGDSKRNSENVIHVADKFEAYLREGKQA